MKARKKSAAGLGDRTEQALQAIGITEDRYCEVKRLFGRMPSCDCQKRKDWLNRVGRHFGIK